MIMIWKIEANGHARGVFGFERVNQVKGLDCLGMSCFASRPCIGRRASANFLRLVSCAFVHTMGFLSNAPVGTASSGCCGRLTQCLRFVSHFFKVA